MKLLPVIFLSFAMNAALADLSSILNEGATVEQLGTDMKFTEGPVWIAKENRLVFSDIPRSLQLQWTKKEGIKEWRKVEASNGNLLDLKGNLLSCQHGGRNLVRTESDGTVKVLVDNYKGKKFNSPNDLAIKSDGTIWFTDPSYGLRGRKAEAGGKWVYRLKSDGSVSVACKTFDMPNGIAFSPDQKRVYIADSGKIGKIHAYDVVEKGLLSDPVFIMDVRCDGMCIDTKGRIYTTSRGGIHIYNSSGKKLGLIPTPEHPANVCFGGKDYDTLFITARKSLYSIKTKAKGQIVTPD